MYLPNDNNYYSVATSDNRLVSCNLTYN